MNEKLRQILILPMISLLGITFVVTGGTYLTKLRQENERYLSTTIMRTEVGKDNESLEIKQGEQEQERQLSDWDIMLLGLIKVESEGNTKAVSTANARGILQLTPIYVKEANRLSKMYGLGKTYTHDDAFDIVKSIEMFEIVSSHKYKQKNEKERIRAIIKGHNPTAGEWYSKRVYKAMEEIKTNEAVRNEYARFLNFV